MDKILELVPEPPQYEIDWDKIENSRLKVLFVQMKHTEQSPVWHKEGNVFKHTQMVAECLVDSEEFKNCDRRLQEELFIAALLHDVGKISETKTINGNITSVGHDKTGANKAREILNEEYDLNGEPRDTAFIDTVCALIEYHMEFLRWEENTDFEDRIKEVAKIGDEVKDFSLFLLSVFVKADVFGRVCDTEVEKENLRKINITVKTAKRLGCFGFPKDKYKMAERKIRILCYGDSNVWGYISNSNHQRYDEQTRWTKLLQTKLGSQYEIIEEGLCSRTLCSGKTDIEEEREKNGFLSLKPCMDTHDEFDVFISMLGVNDFKRCFNNSTADIFGYYKKYIDILKNYRSKVSGEPIKFFIIGEGLFVGSDDSMFDNSESRFMHFDASMRLEYSEIYTHIPIHCFGDDGVHLNKEGHKKVAEICYNKIKAMNLEK